MGERTAPIRDHGHDLRHILYAPSLLATISIGGCVGALARYGVQRALPTSTTHFAWGTFVVNVVGSLCLGLVLGAVTIGAHMHPRRRALLATGALGAFTTFSTWAIDVDRLAGHGHAALAAVEVVAPVVAGVAALVLGMSVVRARHLRRRRAASS